MINIETQSIGLANALTAVVVAIYVICRLAVDISDYALAIAQSVSRFGLNNN